ncbi:hypothetical protein N7E81_06685 [Reichenbachiella carrageenanivorans]|uniref:Uncharacterized protein n=1 Tax=Reichenbachiella carrageenanivorans TaxID=2979869 RepID=A0ABY6D4E5_9BACT|nr:hypothetical protein [Reichenbachiella carrageenanivorans]UXX80784.1 hypothetical protein N7E81_06685 [Reichenbachiella carrageenanivorans]
MSQSIVNFLINWNSTMFILSPIAITVGILIFITFKIKLVRTKTHKEKYDLISKREYSYLLSMHISIAAAIFFICNTYAAEGLTHSFMWFWIRLFIALCIGVLYGYVAVLMLKFYYPSQQARRLKYHRYAPRINPKSGNKMKLLSEEEEDAYLDEGMQAEENVFSVDYDVWIDVETGDTLIEKYEGRLHALECDRCGFQTLKLEKEEITQEASDNEEGELIKHYKCSYCKRIKRRTVKLSTQKSASDFKITDATQFVDDPLHNDPRILAIKIEILTTGGGSQNFEFQNLNEARKFLNEFDLNQLKEGNN